MYDWKIATTDSANGLTAIVQRRTASALTDNAVLITGNNYDEEKSSVNGNGKSQFGSVFMVSPNPANSFSPNYNNSLQN